MQLERGERFLELGFDWYILEHWNDGSSETRRYQHVRLGLEYAQLGHRKRRVSYGTLSPMAN